MFFWRWGAYCETTKYFLFLFTFAAHFSVMKLRWLCSYQWHCFFVFVLFLHSCWVGSGHTSSCDRVVKCVHLWKEKSQGPVWGCSASNRSYFGFISLSLEKVSNFLLNRGRGAFAFFAWNFCMKCLHEILVETWKTAPIAIIFFRYTRVLYIFKNGAK